MKIYYDNIKGFRLKRKIKLLTKQAFIETKQTYKKLSVNVSFVSESTIAQLNLTHRNKDAVTDVLSFPMFNLAPYETVTKEKYPLDVDMQTKHIHIGDIALCLPKAIAQAKELGHSVEREICFLALHGVLHLLGFDHENPNQETQMQTLAEKILLKYKVERKK